MNKDLKTVSSLLSDFNNFINNRSIIFLAVAKDVFPKILDWHFKIWEIECKYLNDKNKLDEWSEYNEIWVGLDSILRRIEERSLNENQTFPFFRQFAGHTEKHKKKSVGVHFYIQTLMATFYQVFFAIKDDVSQRHNFWAHFPEKWKISMSNLKDNENIISWYSWYEFQRWA